MNTIKELADKLGVSKTAVRKHMTEDFRAAHTETDRNGVITIDSDGCKLIAETLGRSEKLSESTENKILETKETSENLIIPRSVWDFTEGRIKQLEDELAKEREHSRNLSDKLATLADQAQQLHAGEMKQQLRMEAGGPQGESAIDVQQAEPEQMKRRRGLFAWLDQRR